jgi:hypothetical protein
MTMGFSFDPGPLPFITIRDQKWASRLAYLPMPLRIHGEHGCPMPRQIAEVRHVEPYNEPCPPGLAHLYAGKRLVAVHLGKAEPCAVRGVVHAWDSEWRMCAHCGEPITTKEASPC